MDAVVATVAAAAGVPLPAGGDGFTIERTYYRLDGSEANISQVAQNERFVVVIKVDGVHDWPSRIIVTDLLPAGFEMDNPGLVRVRSCRDFDWLEETEPAHLRVPRRPLRRRLRSIAG